MDRELLYIIVTNIETLNEYNLSFYEFDELTQQEKLRIPHQYYEIDNFFNSINNPDMEEFNTEYNVITPIYEE